MSNFLPIYSGDAGSPNTFQSYNKAKNGRRRVQMCPLEMSS